MPFMFELHSHTIKYKIHPPLVSFTTHSQYLQWIIYNYYILSFLRQWGLPPIAMYHLSVYLRKKMYLRYAFHKGTLGEKDDIVKKF